MIKTTLIVSILLIGLYLLPKMFLAVPVSMKIEELNESNSITMVLPRGEGFEPWIAVPNCKNFEVKINIYDENHKLIYHTTLNQDSKQLERLGDLLPQYRNNKYCKFLIVQDDILKWKLFHYGKIYTIEISSKKIPKNIILNLDYLKLWFPTHK